MNELKLFYIILGATPEGRNIEQHDVFFGIGAQLRDLVPAMKDFWPEAKGKIHLDAWQEVRFLDGFEVKIMEKTQNSAENQLFFINLGGYKPGIFSELHEQHLMVANSVGEVTKRVKQTEFFKTMGFANAASHIDDRYGVDIDEIFNVEDILPKAMKEKYSILLEKSNCSAQENKKALGYFKIDKL